AKCSPPSGGRRLCLRGSGGIRFAPSAADWRRRSGSLRLFASATYSENRKPGLAKTGTVKRLLTSVAFLASIAAAALAVGSTAQASPSAPLTLTVRSSSYGPILFDGKGRVLYAFTRDPRGGKSRCYGACAAAWPV